MASYLFLSLITNKNKWEKKQSYLAKKGMFYEGFTEEQQDFIDQIEPLNIESRYPTHKDRLLKSMTPDKCREIIDKTKNLQGWIKARL